MRHPRHRQIARTSDYLTAEFGGWRTASAVLLLSAAGVWAYHTSFAGAFLLDDFPHLVENFRIRHLWPLGTVLGGTTRPLVQWTLAVNHALGGLEPAGYHAVNLIVHLAAAVVLFLLIRRTAAVSPAVRWEPGRAHAAALAAALVWLVHPLQTESVTYVIQRAESLAGLFTLATLYAALRAAQTPAGAEGRGRGLWSSAAVSCCALAMASKPVAVVVPLLAALYDRAYLYASWPAAWRGRRGFYLALASTWLLLAWLLWRAPQDYETSAGFLQQRISPAAYALTQPGVLLHYLRLLVWPVGLCLDYADWPVAQGIASAWLPLLACAGLLGATLILWRRSPAAAFPAAAGVLLLLPTSSIIPLLDVAVEHRLYLPSAAWISLIIVGAWSLGWRMLRSPEARRAAAVVCTGAVVLTLGGLTIRRNHDYHDQAGMWRDVIAKRPANARAHNNLGSVLARAGQPTEAVAQYAEALRLSPQLAEPHNNLALALVDLGRLDEAVAHYEDALRLAPQYIQAHYNFGIALAKCGELERARAEYETALRLKPDYADAHNNLGLLLARQGKLAQAAEHYETALRWRPDYAEAANNFGVLLARQGQLELARQELEQALAMSPDYASAHNNLANVLAQLDRRQDAIAHYERALQLQPDYAEARANLTTIQQLPPDS